MDKRELVAKLAELHDQIDSGDGDVIDAETRYQSLLTDAFGIFRFNPWKFKDKVYRIGLIVSDESDIEPI